jgi:hypothetical protein
LTSCKPKIVVEPIYIGIAKIVGKTVAGEIFFEPKEDPKGNYFIVTDGYVKTAMYSLLRIRELELENESLKIALKKKGE